MAHAHAVRRVDLDLPAVWSAVADHADIANWGPGVTVSMERAGTDEPGGVGAIRDIGLPGRHIREEITAFEPNRRLAYRALSGAPFPNWAGEIELAQHQGGTAIKWSLSASTGLPGAGVIMRFAAAFMLGSLARSAVRRAR